MKEFIGVWLATGLAGLCAISVLCGLVAFASWSLAPVVEVLDLQTLRAFLIAQTVAALGYWLMMSKK